MKKRAYTAPKMEVSQMEVSQILAASVTSEWLIEYGGVDIAGEEEPE